MTAQGSDSSRELLTDLVARQLRDAIFNGALKPGERIGQEATAQRFGTSRIPVREALQLLQAEGLVTIRPHSGAHVTPLALGELHDIYEIREHLEPFAIARSTPLLTEDQLKDLTSYVTQMEQVGQEDIGRWIELDRLFHLTAMSHASTRALRIIESLWNGTEHYRRTYLILPERLSIAHLEHRILLETLVSRRSDDAASILLVHIRRTRETLVEHSEMFDYKPAATRRRSRAKKSGNSTESSAGAS
jgi:DNA-binding GntR family transcriptional regulator